RFQNLLASIRGVGTLLSIFGQMRINEDERGYLRPHHLDGARNYPPAIRVTAKDDVVEIFPLEQVDDIRDVGIQIDLAAKQMRPLPKAGQGRRKHLVTLPFK